MSPTHQTRPHILNTRTCPQGHVLVFPLPLPRFEHQKVPMWALSGARAPLLSPPHLEHQNMPVWARSGAHAPPLSLSLVSNTPPRLDHQNEPTRARSGARAPPLSLSLISNLPSPSPSSIYLFSLFLY